MEELVATPPRHKVRSEFLALMYFAHLLPPERVDAVLGQMIGKFEHMLLDELADFDKGGKPVALTPGQRFALGYGRAVLTAALAYCKRQRPQLARALRGEPTPSCDGRHRQRAPARERGGARRALKRASTVPLPAPSSTSRWPPSRWPPSRWLESSDAPFHPDRRSDGTRGRRLARLAASRARHRGGEPGRTATVTADTRAERVTAVRTRVSTAEPMAREVVMNGRTEANRAVRIAAEISGRVARS